MANYSELNLSEEIQKAIDRMGFTEMTEIQALSSFLTLSDLPS